MSKAVIGEKVGAEFLSFMIDGDRREMYSSWYSKIQVNGKMTFITDKTAVKGMANAETRYKAVKLAKKILQEMKIKDAKEEVK